MKEETKHLGVNIGKRVIYFFIEVWLLATILFFMFRMLPGDQMYLLFPRGAPPEVLETWRELLGWDKPLFVQYFSYLGDLITGDLGISFKFAPRTPISSIILPYFAKTVGLVLAAVAISIIPSVIVCREMTKRKGSIVEKIVNITLGILFAVPPFLFALFLIMVFVKIAPGWPLWGAVSDDFNQLSLLGQISDVIQHAFLPLISLTISGFAFFTLLTRQKLIDSSNVNDSSENVSPGHLNFNEEKRRYSLTKTFSTILWTFPLTFGWILANSIIIEYFFTYKGLGYLIWEGVLGYDFPLIMAVIFLLLFILLLASSIALVLKSLIDSLLIPKTPESRPAQEAITDRGGEIGKQIDNEPIISTRSFMGIIGEFSKSIIGLLAFFMLVGFVILAVVGPFIAPENPLIPKMPESYLPQPPSSQYPLGTDFEDKDIWSQFLYGAGSPLLIGIYAATISFILGLGVGIIIRHIGGIGKEICSEILLFFVMIPVIILLAISVILFGRFNSYFFLGIGLFIWIPTALYVGTTYRSNNNLEQRISISQSLPEAIPYALAMTKFMVVIAIISIFTLELFGLGDPNTVSWGWMLERAHAYNAMLNWYWWWIIPPALGQIILVAAFYLFLDRLHEATARKFSKTRPDRFAPSLPQSQPEIPKSN